MTQFFPIQLQQIATVNFVGHRSCTCEVKALKSVHNPCLDIEAKPQTQGNLGCGLPHDVAVKGLMLYGLKNRWIVIAIGFGLAICGAAGENCGSKMASPVENDSPEACLLPQLHKSVFQGIWSHSLGIRPQKRSPYCKPSSCAVTLHQILASRGVSPRPSSQHEAANLHECRREYFLKTLICSLLSFSILQHPACIAPEF